ncbi:F-box domain containing protein [Pandoravirus dulcis]|uniref:F-box domain containing protein n=1 Tax=Pandoravirus dulcis TaxID=1349409 RepID=S4VSI2_9VIRU|nr:F-box domain containing protein [Pandoravirus dulcis]AGO83262.1 F-box domain containing protein [Pandoravirus dulcis]
MDDRVGVLAQSEAPAESARPVAKRRADAGEATKRTRAAKKRRRTKPAGDAVDLFSLPVEIVLCVLSHCTAVDVARVGLTCRWAAAIAADRVSMAALHRRAVGPPCANPLCMGRFGDAVDDDYFAAADPAPLNVVRLVDGIETAWRDDAGHWHDDVDACIWPDAEEEQGEEEEGAVLCARACAQDRAAEKGEMPNGGGGRDDDPSKLDVLYDDCAYDRGIADDDDDDDGDDDNDGNGDYLADDRACATAGVGGRLVRNPSARRLALKQAVVSGSAHGLPTCVVPAEGLRRRDPRTPCGRYVGPVEIGAAIDEPVWCCGRVPPSLVAAVGPLRAMAMADALTDAMPPPLAEGSAAAASVAGRSRGGGGKRRNGARAIKTVRRSSAGHTSTLAWGFWRDGRLTGPGLVVRASCRVDVGARVEARWALAWEDDGSRSDGRFRPAADAPFVERVWRVVGARTAGVLMCRDRAGALGAVMTSMADDGATVDALVGPAVRATLPSIATGSVGPGRTMRRGETCVRETVTGLMGIDDADACLWYPPALARAHTTVRVARVASMAGTDGAVYRGAVGDDGDRPNGHGAVYALRVDTVGATETVAYEGGWRDGVPHGWGRLFDSTTPTEAHRDARPLFVGLFREGAPGDLGTLSPVAGCAVEAAAWWPGSQEEDGGDDDDDPRARDDPATSPAPRGPGVVHLSCGAQLTCHWDRPGGVPVVHAVRHRDAGLGRAVDGGDCTLVVESLDRPHDAARWTGAIERELLRRTDAVQLMARSSARPARRTSARWVARALAAPSLRFRVRCGDSPDAVIVVDLASMLLPWPAA